MTIPGIAGLKQDMCMAGFRGQVMAVPRRTTGQPVGSSKHTRTALFQSRVAALCLPQTGYQQRKR